MARTYEVHGTKAYLYAALVCAFFSLWHIVDGWIPQARWRGAEATATIHLGDAELRIQANRIGTNSNDRVFHFVGITEAMDDPWVAPEDPVVVQSAPDGYRVYLLYDVATPEQVIRAIAAMPRYTASLVSGQGSQPFPLGTLADPAAVLEGGRDGKYPNFPEKWYDLGLREFYAYNRWTGILLGIAALVCAYIHKVVK